MDVYQLIENQIKSRGLTIAEAAKRCELPDSTLRGIISRKQKSIALDVAFKIHFGLGISLEALNGMETSGLSKLEKSEADIAYTSSKEKTKKEIGNILQAIRLKHHLTQTQVSDMLQRPQQTIAAWETGRSQPDANTLFRLFELYGESVDEVFGFRKESTDDKKITSLESRHLKKYRRLNDDGKEKLDGYMDDLLTIEKYSATVRKIEKPILLAGAARTNDGNYDRDNSLTMEEQKELLKKLREVPGLSSDKEI